MSSTDQQQAAAPRPTLTQKQATRAGSSALAMLLCVLATLGISAALMMLAPPPAAPPREDRVDVAAEARLISEIEDVDALAPAVPEPWYANFARWGVAEGVSTWEVGWVVSDKVFAGLVQTDEANPTWLTQRVGAQAPGEDVVVDGVRWSPRAEGAERHWVAELEGTTVILTTTGPEDVLHELARGVAADHAGQDDDRP